MDKLRYIEFGRLQPTPHVALHEWNRKTQFDTPTLLVHETVDLLVAANVLPLEEEFGELPDGLPVRRFYIPRRAPGSALFAEGTLAMHFTHPILALSRCRDAFAACLLRAVRKLGVCAYTRENTNDYYVEIRGAEKKFAGHYAMTGAGQSRVGATVSFDFDAGIADTVFNLASDKIAKKREAAVTSMAQIVGGLHDLAPELVPTQVAEAFALELAKRFDVAIERASLTERERQEWEAMQRVVGADSWVLDAICPTKLQ